MSTERHGRRAERPSSTSSQSSGLAHQKNPSFRRLKAKTRFQYQTIAQCSIDLCHFKEETDENEHGDYVDDVASRKHAKQSQRKSPLQFAGDNTAAFQKASTLTLSSRQSPSLTRTLRSFLAFRSLSQCAVASSLEDPPSNPRLRQRFPSYPRALLSWNCRNPHYGTSRSLRDAEGRSHRGWQY